MGRLKIGKHYVLRVDEVIEIEVVDLQVGEPFMYSNLLSGCRFGFLIEDGTVSWDTTEYVAQDYFESENTRTRLWSLQEERKKGRQLVIGDIHGGLKGLIQAMERAEVTTEDTLIFLGDYVDGWADSALLISYLIELEKTHNCIFIRGNHDEWCENWMTTGWASESWREHGGLTTMASYVANNLMGDKKHLMFFYKMHKCYVDEKNRLFVHGGYTSEKGAEGQDGRILYWNRDLFELAYMVETRTKDNTKERLRTFPKRLKVYDEIFVGHSTTFIFNGADQPINALNAWNVDTGAGTNGRVTVMDVDTKEFWQSDVLPSLYPDDEHNEFAKLFLPK